MRARRCYRLALAAGLGILGAVAAWYASAPDSGTEQMPVAVVVRSSPSAGATLAKFYVVGEAIDGQREFLFDVAARTLGDGKRYLEIFELNKGRPQPGGRQMNDPAELEPGWVLLLPADASGPDVRVGILPIALPEGLDAERSAEDPSDVSAIGVFGDLIRTTAIVGVLFLLVWAVRRQAARSRLLLRTSASASATAGIPEGRVLPAAAHEPPDVPSVRSPPVASVAAKRGILNAQVLSGGDLVVVRLVGTRTDAGPDIPTWTCSQQRPSGAAIVSLGENTQGTLYVNLATAPDVVTVTGAPKARERLSLSLAQQLAQSGVRVTVVGDPFETLTQPGFRFVTSFDDAASDVSRAADELGVIFYGGPGRDDLATIRSTVSRRNPHIVVVIVGDVRPARWSLDVGREQRRS